MFLGEVKYKHYHIFKLLIVIFKTGNKYERCARFSGLQPTNPGFYPQSNRCNDPPVKRTKSNTSTKNDFIS